MTEDDRISVALVDDFEVVVHGVAAMLEPFSDRIRIADLSAGEKVEGPVDVVLFDTFAQGEVHADDIQTVLNNPLASNVIVYTFNTAPELIALAQRRGVRGYVSKAVGAEELADAIERVHAGEEVVVSPGGSSSHAAKPRSWPGREAGLTEREAEVLSLAARGHTNAEIAERLFISINSVKTHVRNLYRKIDVRNRAEAVVWAIDNGLRPSSRAIDAWQTDTASAG